MNRTIVIYGASGHGKVIADIAGKRGYGDILFYDDDPEKKTIGGHRILHEFPEGDYDIVVAIGENATRQLVSERLDRRSVTMIHPDAVVADDVQIGEGSVVMAGAVINPGTVIGKGVIVNTYASLDHDNRIGDYAHVSVNAHTAGTVSVGERTFIGMGSNVINNITICADVTVGAGSLVIRDIEEKGTYAGSPVRKIR